MRTTHTLCLWHRLGERRDKTSSHPSLESAREHLEGIEPGLSVEVVGGEVHAYDKTRTLLATIRASIRNE